MSPDDLSRNLFENGLDFIRQSLKDFEEKRFKYSVIHFSSGVEVILKAIIAAQDWQMILRSKKYSYADLAQGNAQTKGIHECLAVIGNKLGLTLRDEGEGFKQVAYERNRAIHFFIEGDEEKISWLHYQAFEDLWFFFQRHPEKAIISRKELKRMAIDLGKLIRRVSGNAIDDFFSRLDQKRDQLLKRLELLQSYRKSLCWQIYRQELTFNDDNGDSYSDWEIYPLGDLCKIRSRKQGHALPLRINGDTRVWVDRTGNESGLIIAWLKPGSLLEPFFLSIAIDVHQRYFWQRSVGIVRRPSLSAIGDLAIKLPCYAEQQKIAGFIALLDERIVLLEKQFDTYGQFEKTIKQKMFV